MTADDGLGHVLKIVERPKSRRKVTATASDYGQEDVTLSAGLLGTSEGDAVIRLAMDRRARIYAKTAPKPRRKD